MDFSYLQSLSYNEIRKLYRAYLQSQILSKSTVGTMLGDSFYLWKNDSKDKFWKVVSSENFDLDAKNALFDALTMNSSGNVEALVNGYVYQLRKLKDFLINIREKPIVDDETALKNFLLDIDCLNPLNEWTSKFNMFDILKISRTEIRHSNMLAWLLDPNENHGFGDKVVRGFVQYLVSSSPEGIDVFNILLMDYYDFEILREWQNIDLLAVSQKNNFLICIENKIDTGEHDKQLDRYKETVDKYYKSYAKLFIYLTPDGYDSSQPDLWYSMSYQDVLNIIDNALKNTKVLPESELLINNYLDTLRRNIVGDEKLRKICADIYAKHKKALDLIFENKPDKASELSDILSNWAEDKTNSKEIIFVPEKSAKSYIRFKTETMSRIMPDAEGCVSGWGTPNYYFYEIKNILGKEFYIQFVLSSKDIPDNLRDICEKINGIYRAKMNKTNWQWRTPFATKSHFKIKDEEFEIEAINKALNKMLDEVRAFESDLFKKLSIL